MAGGTGDLDIDSAFLATIDSNASDIIIGRLDGTGDIEVGAFDWSGENVTLRADSGEIIFGGTQSNFNNFTVQTDEDIDVDYDLTGLGNILIQSGDDIALLADIITTSSDANGLVLDSEGSFYNVSGDLSALNSRWIIYSKNPASNARGSLLPDVSEFGKTYDSDAPNTIGSGNRFIYDTSTQPVLTFTLSDETVEYGDNYGGTPTATYASGLVSSDTVLNIGLTGSENITVAYNNGDNAALYTGSITATSGTLSNPLGYLYAFTSGDLTVTKAPLIVTVDDKTKIYGDVNPYLSSIITGFKLDDDIDDLDIAPTYSTDADINSDAGLYDIISSGGLDINYDFDYVDADLTVQKADLNIFTTQNIYRRFINEENPEFEIAYDGFKLGDTAPETLATATTTATKTSTFGDYDITLSGAFDPNYNMIYHNPPAIVRIVTPIETLPDTVIFRTQEASVQPQERSSSIVEESGVTTTTNFDLTPDISTTNMSIVEFHPDLSEEKKTYFRR